MNNYLQEVATMAVTYSEVLNKDESKVAETLGISQVKVSREEKKILEKLRVSLTTN